MMRVFYRVSLICFLVWLIAPGVLAESTQSSSLGEVSTNLMGPVGAITSMLRAVCIITGLGLFMGSIVKYSDHRKNPIPNPLSTIVVMFIGGLSLIALAFIPLLNVKGA